MWARIDDYRVIEVTDIDPTGRFHSTLHWVICSTETRPGWCYDGDQCQPPPPVPIDFLAASKRQEIVSERDKAFAAGMPYDIAGVADVVQTRPQDQINLLALNAKAQRLIAAGEAAPIMQFRGKSNITHQLPPDQIELLTLAALSHMEDIWQRSWELKDAIHRAQHSNDREAIEQIRW